MNKGKIDVKYGRLVHMLFQLKLIPDEKDLGWRSGDITAYWVLYVWFKDEEWRRIQIK